MTKIPACGKEGWALAMKIDGNLVRQILLKKLYATVYTLRIIELVMIMRILSCTIIFDSV